MALVNQFQTKFENAVTLYGAVANDIRKLARSVNISSQLNEFSNVLATLRNRNPQMLQEIKSVVLKFQQLELEARRYVELAKSFAQENIYVAQNVLNGVRYYDPESILQNFKETAEGFDKAYPLSPNSEQDQFSPNNIYTLSTDKLWELIKWSPK